jgi:hypothetical protein
MALSDQHQSYEKPMKRFLNEYIKDNRNQDAAWLNIKKNAFIGAIEKAALISDKPFHLKGKLNYAALDSILIALMESTIVDKGTLAQRYERLTQDETFISATSMNTSDKQEVSDRIRITKEIFS